MNVSKLSLFVSANMLMACQTGKKMAEMDTESSPNVIIVFCDDLGYADIEPFGAADVHTPNLNLLAKQGMTLTNFQVGSSVSSPSRAALLTGCYPVRVGITDVLPVHGTNWSKELWRDGLNPDEETLPELLKKQAYSTAIFGKWHLGHMPENLPTHHGFDTFWGTPYSNDMYPPTDAAYPPLPIIENTKIVEENPDQSQFTRRLTEKTLDFIDTHSRKPFFVYLAHPMPHVPIAASEGFKGKSKRGLYGDVIEEIDWSVGQIMHKLQQLQLDKNTILIFTSDNGPWLAFGNHAGSAFPLREGKHTTFDGGQRTPFIIRYPAKIKQNTKSNEIVAAMDLLPTIAAWAKAPLSENKIDGIAQNRFFEHKQKHSNRTNMLYYYKNEAQAYRRGNWKIHIPHTYQKAGARVANNGVKGQYDKGQTDYELYNMKTDPSETNNLANRYPAILQQLIAEMKEKDAELKLHARKPNRYKGTEPEKGKLW